MAKKNVAPLSDIGFDPDPSPVTFDDPAGDGESNPGSRVLLRRMQSLEYCWIDPDPGSDHHARLTNVRLSKEAGPGWVPRQRRSGKTDLKRPHEEFERTLFAHCYQII
jgi:hypothetical protein